MKDRVAGYFMHFLARQKAARSPGGRTRTGRKDASQFGGPPPRNAGKPPLCPDCGGTMTWFYYAGPSDSDWYGCWGCSPPWEGE